MNKKSIIIIGAGIAGLSTGCYGQMNGYRTQIFEMHDEIGGCCTSWKRKGYTIEQQICRFLDFPLAIVAAASAFEHPGRYGFANPIWRQDQRLFDSL